MAIKIKMENKKILIFGFTILLIVFLINFVNSQEISYCCEKTIYGASCQVESLDNCDPDYRKEPGFCEATEFCKIGTCIDSNEGVCMPNTPKSLCENPEEGVSGLWKEGNPEDIPQCQIGCCLYGNQAGLNTFVGCRKKASDNNVEFDFIENVQTQEECLAMATPEAMGACVLEIEAQRTCKFETKRECQEQQGEFYEEFLCTAIELATNCAPTTRTTCFEERVHFIDSCSNIANVYDSSKIYDKSRDNPVEVRDYWTKIKSPTCGDNTGNKGSQTCGACEYYLGSTCKPYDRTIDGNKPNLIGNNICRDLDCKYDLDKDGTKEIYAHGSKWCADAQGIGKIEKINDALSGGDNFETENLPGSEYIVLECRNGEILVEPCAARRAEVCFETTVNEVSNAVCSVNKWQDCLSQETEEECENQDIRDCKWIEGTSNSPNYGRVRQEENSKGACVLRYPPGFKFWDPETKIFGLDISPIQICSIANTKCTVEYRKSGALGDWEVKGEITCLKDDGTLLTGWVDDQINLCLNLGDCGIKLNYLEGEGYLTNWSEFLEGNYEGEYE